ncbi:hypothetical protein Tco_0500789 [Tanacetum coccineum]
MFVQYVCQMLLPSMNMRWMSGPAAFITMEWLHHCVRLHVIFLKWGKRDATSMLKFWLTFASFFAFCHDCTIIDVSALFSGAFFLAPLFVYLSPSLMSITKVIHLPYTNLSISWRSWRRQLIGIVCPYAYDTHSIRSPRVCSDGRVHWWSVLGSFAPLLRSISFGVI